MKRKIITLLLSVAAVICCVCALPACATKNEESEKRPSVSYGTVTVHYHYEYDTVIETYWQQKYSIQIGITSEITEFYTPPQKTGYRFLGWTKEEGGDGEVITSLSVKGSGGQGTLYQLYAKYEPIDYTAVYHLDGGTNNPNNPTEFTGKKKLSNPTKENYKFLGWYTDAEFKNPIYNLPTSDNSVTTINLYAKWTRIYKINYTSNIAGMTVKGDINNKQFTESDSEDIFINLDPEYKDNYLFLGWTYEGQTEPVKEVENFKITPSEQNSDVTFTANYLAANNGANTPGLEVAYNLNEGRATITVPADVEKIVVEDLAGTMYNHEYFVYKVIIKYKGEKPEVITSDKVTQITYEQVS